MATYSYTKTVNPLKLQDEIEASTIASFYSHIEIFGTSVTVFTNSDLSTEDQTTLDGIISAHTTSYSKQIVNGVILKAQEFGLQLIRDFGTRNILAGKTDAQIDAVMDNNSDIHKIGMGLLSGSLKYARRKIEAMTPDGVGITTDDQAWMIAQITAYLGD